MIRRSITMATAAGALSLGLVFAASGAASAHECYVVKRSDQGTVGASHSGNWYHMTLEGLLAEAPEIIGAPPLNAEQTAWALAQADMAGIPDSFAIFTKFTLPKGHSPERLITDAKGIDSFFAKYIDQLIGIYMAALEM